MYLKHYRLVLKPFQISPDPKFLWLGEKHKEALAVLKYGILNNQGFVLLSGEVGTGKTTLVNSLVQVFQEDVIVATVPDPTLSKIELFNFIAHAFNLQKTFKNKLEFLLEIRDFLIKSFDDNKKVLLIVDEAHKMTSEFLEELRLLSNIEKQHTKLINIFFVGQSELNTILQKESNRALRQRITITYNIEPLTLKETGEYVEHRLKVAGADRQIFTPRAVKKIYGFASGYPRLTNIICDRALLSGYVRDLDKVDAEIVRECSKELSLPGEVSRHMVQSSTRLGKGKWVRRSVSGVLIVFGIAAGYLLFTAAYSDPLLNLKNYYDRLLEQIQITTRRHTDTIENRPLKKRLDIDRLTEKRESGESTHPKLESSVADESPASDDDPTVDNDAEEEIPMTDVKLIIPFEHNGIDIYQEAYASLDKVAVTMLRNPASKIVIKGYTAGLGNSAYNKRLSEFRAKIVRNYLVGKGINPKRIETVAMGGANPLKPNTTAQGRAANRRVEIEVISNSD